MENGPVLPRPTLPALLALASAVGSRPSLGLVVDRARGAWLQDPAGNRVMDLGGGDGAAVLGHRPPALVAAVSRQLMRAGLAPFGAFSDAEVLAHAKLADTFGYARAGLTPCPRSAAAWLCDQVDGPVWAAVSPAAVPPGARRLPWGTLPDSAGGAVIVAPALANQGGLELPPDGWMAALMARAERQGARVVLDAREVGPSRSGALLPDLAGRRPDAVLLGNALASGLMPCGAVLGGEGLWASGGPPGAGALAAAATMAALDALVVPDLVVSARALGDRLCGAIRGAGLTPQALGAWVGVPLDRPASAVCRGLLQRGILTTMAGERALRLAPPLTISSGELDWAVETLRAGLES